MVSQLIVWDTRIQTRRPPVRRGKWLRRKLRLPPEHTGRSVHLYCSASTPGESGYILQVIIDRYWVAQILTRCVEAQRLERRYPQHGFDYVVYDDAYNVRGYNYAGEGSSREHEIVSDPDFSYDVFPEELDIDEEESLYGYCTLSVKSDQVWWTLCEKHSNHDIVGSRVPISVFHRLHGSEQWGR